MNEPVLVVDNSALRQFAACERAGWLTALGKRSEESKYLVRGRAIGAGVGWWLAGQGFDAAMAVVRAEGALLADPGFVAQDEADALPNVERIMAGWMNDHPLDKLPWVTTAVEVPFAQWLDDAQTVLYVGSLDAAGADRLNQQYVVETKSSGACNQPSWRAQWRLDTGITGYVWSRQQEGVPCVGVMLNGVHVKKAPASGGKCKVHGVTYSECGTLSPHLEHFIQQYQRTPEAIDEWRRMATLAAYRLRTALTVDGVDDEVRAPTGMFHGQCAWCGFHEACEVGLTPALVDQMDASTWEPFPGARPGTFQQPDDVFDAVRTARGEVVHV